MRLRLPPRNARLLLAFCLLSSALAAGCKKEDEGAANATCGKKGLPDCPTQAWMKANMKPAFDKKDPEKLAQVLDEVAAHPPEGFAGWDKIAKAGADAARANDMEAVKASCKMCHDDHRSRFKKEIRDKPLL